MGAFVGSRRSASAKTWNGCDRNPAIYGTAEMGSRNPNRASSVYLGSDGSWHGRVTVGYRDDGALDRRHVRGQSKIAVVQKVRELEKIRDQGRVSRVGKRWTSQLGWSTGLRTLPGPTSGRRVTRHTERRFGSISSRELENIASTGWSLSIWSVCTAK